MIKYRQSSKLSDLHKIHQYLKDLNHYYPNFDDWFINIIMPDITIGDGILLIAENNNNLVGALIGKKGSHPKLRCMKISPEYQNKAIGKKLIDKMLIKLECEKPSATVCEEHIHLYSRLFINHYKFSLDSVEKNMYRPGKLEYIFNDPKKHEISSKTQYGLY